MRNNNNSLFQLIGMILMVLFLFQVRYVLLNVILRFPPLRRFAVSSFMRMPFMRGMFIKQAFKY
ncbi:hypothetical protein LC040_10755 [Bacillus tianshenii]|nr:hypothetical protein LC040_10755 [Bacillus tianshenii]